MYIIIKPLLYSALRMLFFFFLYSMTSCLKGNSLNKIFTSHENMSLKEKYLESIAEERNHLESYI